MAKTGGEHEHEKKIVKISENSSLRLLRTRFLRMMQKVIKSLHFGFFFLRSACVW